MKKIAWDGYLFSHPDSAFYFAQMQYELAEATGNKKQMASALNTKGVSLMFRGKYEEALDYFKENLKNEKEIDDPTIIGSAYNNIASVYADQGNYKEALDCYQKSLKIRKEIGDQKNIGGSYNNIAMVYAAQGNNEEALYYHEKGLKIKKEIGDQRGQASSYNNIGNVYDNLGNSEKALYYYKESLKLYKKLGNNWGIAHALGNVANVLEQQGSFEEALRHHHESLEIQKELDDKMGMAVTLGNIGVTYKNTGNYQKALHFAKNALEISREIGALDRIDAHSILLYKIYKQLGDYPKALQMHELYLATRDTLDKKKGTEEFMRMEMQRKYELQQQADSIKHEHDIIIQQEQTKAKEVELKSEKTLRGILFAGIGIISLLLLFAINRFLVTRNQKDTIEGQKQIVEEQKELVEEQKKDLTDSIHYAENIQQSLLPTIEDLKEVLPDGFVLFQPKDIVSGDFYWLQHHKDKVYFAVCDCTGHGVPGAFMSMIGYSLLDEAVVEKGITKPNEIFFEVRKGFINALKQTEESGTQKDGMDAVLCSWNKNGNLEYALAYNPLLLIRKGELIETKADKQPVGFHTVEQKPFTHHELKLEKGDTVYIFSDGYPDQFGGPKDKKFMMKNFKKLLLSIQDKTMNEQKTILEDTMAEWKGDTEQIDDILVMGVRF